MACLAHDRSEHESTMSNRFIKSYRNPLQTVNSVGTVTHVPLRVVILGASFETHNMGVGALAAGTITSVLHQDPEAQIWLFDYAKEPTVRMVRVCGRDVGIPLVNIRFSKRVYLPNNIALLIAMALVAKCIPSKKLCRRIVASNKYLELLSRADIIASLAGGDSFSDIYGMARLIYVSLPQILAVLLNKHMALLPQTIGPFKSRLAKAVARFIMARTAQIYSRDFEGIGTCRALLESTDIDAKKVSFCYDMGFVLDPVSTSSADIAAALDTPTNMPVVGLNVSGLLLMGGYTKKNMFGLGVSYRDLILRIIDYFIRQENANVLLVPHVFGSDMNSESDAIACEKIYTALTAQYGRRLRLLRGDFNQSEIKAVIGRCDFFIGARMHSCIAALSQSVPAVAVAYSDKFIGVLQTLGIERLVVDPRTMDEEAIVQAIALAYKDRDLIRQKLERKVPDVQETVLNLFAFLDPLTTRPRSYQAAEVLAGRS